MVIPIILFISTFLLDNYVTGVGISLDGQEGNPIVVWLWSVFGYESVLLRVSYILFIILIALFLKKKMGIKYGLIFLYSFAVGHFLGFSSWVQPTIVNTLTLGLYYFLWKFSIYILFIFALIYGYLLACVHLTLIRLRLQQ